MYPRILTHSETRSFFLFGPRGTGKSSWIKKHFAGETYIDLLDDQIYRELLSKPELLPTYISPNSNWVIIDEVQRVPSLLNHVHKLIEERSLKFILSGSSARKLKRIGTNLLAGRALTMFLHPFTSEELGQDFELQKALQYGMLPEVWDGAEYKKYLQSYVTTYLKEEVQQEGLTRNIGTFSRFLEIASFSQASPLNVSEIAREISLDNKTVENYFTILEDLLLAIRIPVFTKHAKRKMYQRPKFFYFDVGVYRTLRPKGPLDTPELIDGASLETLLMQEIRAINNYRGYEYDLFYWRTRNKLEIDLILYGPMGVIAIEIKRSTTVTAKDLKALSEFLKDYPMAKGYLFYGGTQKKYINGVEIIPFDIGIIEIDTMLSKQA